MIELEDGDKLDQIAMVAPTSQPPTLSSDGRTKALDLPQKPTEVESFTPANANPRKKTKDIEVRDLEDDDDDDDDHRESRIKGKARRRDSDDGKRKPSIAWSESDFSIASFYDVQQTVRLDATGVVHGPRKKRSMRRRIVVALGMVVCLVQCMWSVVIPIKNVFMIQYPVIPPDSVTMKFPDTYEPGSAIEPQRGPMLSRPTDPAVQATALPGSQLPRLLDRVASIVISNNDVRQELEKMQRFEIDSIFKFLSFDEMELMLQYYALVMQSSEFPAGRFTVRQFNHSASSSPSSSSPPQSTTPLTIIMQDSLSQQNLSLELACFQENAALVGTRCINKISKKPCVLATTSNSQQTFGDVLLPSIESNSSLDNNIGLLYMVEFFHTTMSNLFETQDWTRTLEAVGFYTDRAESLDKGSLSGFTRDSTPFLSIADAFLLGIDISSLENWKLESCFAAELVTAHFFTRSLVLHVVHNALARQQFPYRSIKPSVPISRRAAMVALEPLLTSEVHFSSGVALASRKEHSLGYFRRNTAMSSQRFLQSQAKLDRRFNVFEEPLSSSMRMIQFMAFYPDLVSTLTTVTNLKLPMSPLDPNDAEPVYYDSQQYKLLGAFGAVEGVVGFDDDQQVAKNSRFALLLKELPRTDPAFVAFDQLFVQEDQLAKWFAGQPENALVQVVFDPFLVIAPMQSEFATATMSPTADSFLACHRSLLKVMSKVVYLTLIRMNPSVWFFMFASDASIGNENWLVSQIFKEEMVLEATTGDKVAFAYRNQPAKQSALSVPDGSSWVVLPLIRLLLDLYGNSVTMALLMKELDNSFELFAKKTSQGLFNFPDLSRCKIAAKNPYSEVTSGDTMALAYGKLRAPFQSSFAALVGQVPALVNSMESQRTSNTESLLADELHQLLVSNPDLVKDKLPLGWYPTEVTVGLWKLWPSTTPTAATVASARSALSCFAALDLRSLNATTRCFVEKAGVQVQVESFEASILRDFLLTNWSMGIMLNTLAAAVILKYLKKFVRAWQTTRFHGLTIKLALQLNIQGLSVLTKSQSALMMLAGVPLLLNLHFPFDQVIVQMASRDGPTSITLSSSIDLAALQPQYSKAMAALLMTLSMTWLLKAGFDFANAFFRPNRPIDWLRLYLMRLFLAMVIFVVLLLVGHAKHDGSMGFLKLLLTCGGSFLLGLIALTGIVFLPERKLQVQVNNGQSEQQQEDGVLAALIRQKMPLNKYGVLGRTARGYSREGLIMEGWRVAKTHDGKLVLRRDGGEIPMPKPTDEDEDVHPQKPDKPPSVIPVTAIPSPRPQEL